VCDHVYRFNCLGVVQHQNDAECSQVCFVVVAFRIRDVSLSVCDRAFLALDVVLWFIRLLILLMIDRTVGPMLLMIQAMVGVVCALCALILACTLAHAHRLSLPFDLVLIFTRSRSVSV
jgi:hypothetical protein